MRELEANNDRDWFKARKERYEEDVREPALDFISDFAPKLQTISKYFVADARPMGGSLFRIHRDTRFSKDKTPYKTHTGIHFRHAASADDVHAPGFYLHLEPGNSFAAMGLWHPATQTARDIRGAISEDPAGWKKGAYGKRFADAYQLEGESLKRLPKEFDPDHPYADDLRRKDFIASTRLKQSEITSADFLNDYTKLSKTGAPFMAFLCEAVGVRF